MHKIKPEFVHHPLVEMYLSCEDFMEVVIAFIPKFRLYFLSLCVHQTLMCYWVTAWCWSVLLCMPCLTWVRSTRWRTWAGWSSWAWWDFSGRWSVVYKCNLLHCNVALRWWEDVLKWVRCASNVSELCNHQDYWCLHLLIVLSFKWISFLTSWTWAFLVVLFQLC